MPRLFIGIEVPGNQGTMLALSQSGLENVRWVAPEDLHITLRFIGDVTTPQANAIYDALHQKNWPQPTIKLGELKAFGGSTPKSIYASVSDDECLLHLQTKQERLCQRLGLEADSRKFTPHVTIGRCSKLTADAVALYLGSHGGFIAPAYRPSSFVLYSARDSIGGGPYHVEARFPFI